MKITNEKVKGNWPKLALKGTLSPNKMLSYMKDIPFLNIIHKLKISFEPPFIPKIAD